jgi:phenylalanyl-tRNA synthetase alpha chain
MILYGIDNIRSLIGPKVDLEMCQQNPICRVEAVKDEDAKNEA